MIHVLDNDADAEKHQEASEEAHPIKTTKEVDVWEWGDKINP